MLKLLAFLPLAAAHFTLEWPTKRGFDDDKAVNYPCGGFDSVSANRTSFPLSGGPIQLNMGHTEANVQVNLALGNGDGSYSIQLLKPFQEIGPNNFCMGSVTFPSNLNLTEGTNATLQVITNGDPDGGLYQCADITFTSATLSTNEFNSHCQNSTGVSTAAAAATIVNVNGTTNGASATGSASGGSASPTSTRSTGGAPQVTAAKWALGAAGVMGVIAAL